MTTRQIDLGQISGGNTATNTGLLIANTSANGQYTNVYSSGNLGFDLANTVLTIKQGNGNSFTGNTGNDAVILYANDTSGTFNVSIRWTDNGLVKARIAVQSNGAGTFMRFGTSNNFNSGVTNQGLMIDQNGRLIANSSPINNTQTQVMTGLASFLKANTTRTNISALTNEANLTLTVNEVGVYKLDAGLNFATNAGSTGACGMVLDFGGGTIGISNANFITHYRFNGVSGDQVTGVNQVANGGFGFTVGTLSTAGQDFAKFDGVMQVSAPGTMILRYAQNFANTGQSVILIANSTYFMLTKIG